VLTVGSTIARSQPLTIAITTAGYDKTSICWEMHEYARKIINGIFKDDQFLGIIYAADPEDDWKKPATWKKANPNFGDSVSEEYLARLCKEAQKKPALENLFKRLHLNIWTSQSSRWLKMEDWDKCAGDVEDSELKGLTCHAGLDMSSTTDLSAITLGFPLDEEMMKVVPFFFMPKDSIEQRSEDDRVPYDLWAKQGFIIPTMGNVIDYDHVIAVFKEIRAKYHLVDIAYDPWNATKLVQDLEKEGFVMVPMRQNFSTMSPPIKELERKVISRKLIHGNNPVMRWMMDNVQAITDSSGNIKLDKSRSTGRIDGVIGMVMAIDRITRSISGGESVYEKRGIITL
jgi:phage terminase large subunit-like protein